MSTALPGAPVPRGECSLAEVLATLDHYAPLMAGAVRYELDRVRRQAAHYRVRLREVEAELAELREERD